MEFNKELKEEVQKDDVGEIEIKYMPLYFFQADFPITMDVNSIHKCFP